MDEQDLLRKLSGLLAKAESTDNEAEAKAFFEKAFDMMTRYAIDEERVREAQRAAKGGQVEEPIRLNYMYSSYAHHAEAKTELIGAIAKHLSVRIFFFENRKGTNAHLVAAEGKSGLHESQWCWVVGYKSDIEAMKLLFLSLMIQSQKFANEDWRTTYGEAKEAWEYDERYEETRPIGRFAWIGEHMVAFSGRINQRFRELKNYVQAEVADSSALVVNKEANIQEWMYEAGFMRRPAPPATTRTCYAVQPKDDPGWPKTRAGKPNERYRAHYCYRRVHTNAIDAAGPDGEHVDGNPAHTYTYDPGPNNYNYSVSIGRRTSSVGRAAGSRAAERADIGLTRVGNRNALKG